MDIIFLQVLFYLHISILFDLCAFKEEAPQDRALSFPLAFLHERKHPSTNIQEHPIL
jgi:hypothetical protein